MELKEMAQDFEVIGIDEGQFFPDLVEMAEYCSNRGKHVIISALDGDFERKPFGQVCDLIPLSEKVEKLQAICMLCKDENAVFNLRLIESQDKILVGSDDIYKSVCRKCYMSNHK